ncbi:MULTISPECIES: hypothetical protein [Methylobacteriaceae]
MSKLSMLSGAAALMIVAGGGAMAAPCATGTTTSTQGPKTGDTSSNVQGGSTEKVTPGAKGESPGTVGALNQGSTSVPKDGEGTLKPGQRVEGQNSNDC